MTTVPPLLSERVLYEDNHIIIVHKLAGEIVQADKTEDETLADKIRTYLREKYNKLGNIFVGIVHRIDRPVSGVVIFAKTSKALLRMNAIFKERNVKKYYLAIVAKEPSSHEQTLTHFLRKNEALNKSFVSKEPKEGYLTATLHYKYIRPTDNYHILEIELFTGRHHQIRAQLSANGTIIKGDLKYGAKRSNPDASISLQAQRICFTHPVSNIEIDIETPYELRVNN